MRSWRDEVNTAGGDGTGGDNSLTERICLPYLLKVEERFEVSVNYILKVNIEKDRDNKQ